MRDEEKGAGGAEEAGGVERQRLKPGYQLLTSNCARLNALRFEIWLKAHVEAWFQSAASYELMLCQVWLLKLLTTNN